MNYVDKQNKGHKKVERLSLLPGVRHDGYVTNALNSAEDDAVKKNGYAGTTSEASCDNGSDEPFSKQDIVS
ncbi:hypothetical protein TNCV_1658281 [Trichonephila clavipes]|nr:hypothetical protein TNCV_1658281 [Trichonephila clavipes]